MAILLDPEKIAIHQQSHYLKYCEQQFKVWETDLDIDFCFFLIGGSTMNINMNEWLAVFKKITNIPTLIFPGSHEQLSENADGLLFLQLLSGRNPEYLIEQQVRAAAQLKSTSLEIIPTGYLLIDGGVISAVQHESFTQPLLQKEITTVVNTAYAAQLMGHQLVYLEAGSGALYPVNEGIIKAVHEQLDIPIIVGGGLSTTIQMEAAFNAGASIVVIGTAIENKLL